MIENKLERRKSARVYLKPDNATALIKVENSPVEFAASILNVSEGGFGLGIERSEGVKISPGDSFVIRDIIGRKELVNEKEITISVKWVLDHHGMESFGAGCAFIGIDQSYQNKIHEFLLMNS